MYAFVALEADLNTVKSLVYYRQGETAGLGGVQNRIGRNFGKVKSL